MDKGVPDPYTTVPFLAFTWSPGSIPIKNKAGCNIIDMMAIFRHESKVLAKCNQEEFDLWKWCSHCHVQETEAQHRSSTKAELVGIDDAINMNQATSYSTLQLVKSLPALKFVSCQSLI